MSNAIGLVIESLVAILLAFTIGYCVLLNRRLKTLKGDEQALKAMISELITATEIAERAIAGLKLTVGECDQTLGARVRIARQLSEEIARQLEEGEDVVERVAQIVLAARSARPSSVAVAIAPETRAIAAAAQAFAKRARLPRTGAAA